MNNATYADAVFYAVASERAAFIRRTYAHLALAVLAFIAVEWMLLQSPIAAPMARAMTGGFSWLIVLAAFMGVSWLAERWANSDTSPRMQYLGLGLYVVAQAIIFLPLLFVAANFSSPDVIPMAALITGFLFTGLTATVFITRKDFSWMRGILTIGGFVALGVIAASIIFGFSLGIIFSAIMVLFASVAILYDTSQVLHHYRTDQHVAASLSLFASVALLFWYILRIVMSLSSDDD
ncbi:MAG: Bax inhibitor-1/YccA family protein [Blastocatellia bacterium]